MLKQRITDPYTVPASLADLVGRVLRHLGDRRQMLDVFRLTAGSDLLDLEDHAPRYVIDTGTHMTPTFSVTGEGVVIEHADDVGAMSSMNLEDAARLLAGELAEVA